MPGRFCLTWACRWALVLLSLVPSPAMAGTITVDVDLDSATSRLPGVGSSPTSSFDRVLVPIPRLSAVTSCDVALPHSDTESSESGVPVFSGETVEGGKAQAVFKFGSGIAHRLSCRIEYGPLSATERPKRESLLSATRDGRVDGLELTTKESGVWYADADTSCVQFFGCAPPEDFHFGELSRFPVRCDVVLPVLVGGWGRIPLEQADDIASTVFAVRDSLRSWGLSVFLIPYRRVARGTWDVKLLYLAETFGAHHSESRSFAWDIADFVAGNPGTHVVLVGLSNGATFAGQTMSLLDSESVSRVSAVELGPPCWNEDLDPPNTLILDNEGRDPYAVGQFDAQIAGCVSAFGRYLSSLLTDRPTRFLDVFVNPGHEYSWKNVSHRVVPFLRSRLELDSR